MEDQTSEQAEKQPKPAGTKTGMAILAYILFFVPLLTKSKDDPFVKYHVKQGLVLFILGVIVWLIANVIPIFGFLLSPILNIFLVVLLIIGIINAANGAEKPLPIVGSFADKLKF